MKKPSQLTFDEWALLYPKYTMKQIAEQLQCGETTVHTIAMSKRIGNIYK